MPSKAELRDKLLTRIAIAVVGMATGCLLGGVAMSAPPTVVMLPGGKTQVTFHAKLPPEPPGVRELRAACVVHKCKWKVYFYRNSRDPSDAGEWYAAAWPEGASFADLGDATDDGGVAGWVETGRTPSGTAETEVGALSRPPNFSPHSDAPVTPNTHKPDHREWDGGSQ